jgi:hypothetical protein
MLRASIGRVRQVVTDETVRRERRWTSRVQTPGRELVRSMAASRVRVGQFPAERNRLSTAMTGIRVCANRPIMERPLSAWDTPSRMLADKSFDLCRVLKIPGRTCGSVYRASGFVQISTKLVTQRSQAKSPDFDSYNENFRTPELLGGTNVVGGE